MTRFYPVQLTPDPVRDEKFNVGVLVETGGKFDFRASKSLSRTAKFSGIDEATLKQMLSLFELKFIESSFVAEVGVESIDETGPLKLGNPGLSMLGHYETIEFAFKKLVDVPYKVHKKLPASRKSDAIRIGKESLQNAMDQYYDLLEDHRVVDSSDAVVIGSVPHHVDFGLKNGSLKIGCFGISLDLQEEAEIVKQINNIAAISYDIRRNNVTIPMSVLAINSKEPNHSMLERVEAMLLGDFVDVIKPQQSQEWFESKVSELAQK